MNKVVKIIAISFVLFIYVASISAQESQTTKTETAQKQNIVYITKSGSKYHARGCRTLRKSNSVSSISVDQAKKRGLEACKVCGGGI